MALKHNTLSALTYTHEGICNTVRAWTVHRKSKRTETENGETDEEQSQEHIHHFLWHQRDCSQRICIGRSNSQFSTLLWHFTATAWKFAKTSPRTLATKKLAVASRQRTVSYFLFHQGIFYQKQHDCCPPPILVFSVSTVGTSHMSDIRQMTVAMQRLVYLISMKTKSTLLRNNTGANSTLLSNYGKKLRLGSRA
jgi:hypothetical protein